MVALSRQILCLKGTWWNGGKVSLSLVGRGVGFQRGHVRIMQPAAIYPFMRLILPIKWRSVDKIPRGRHRGPAARESPLRRTMP